MFYAFLNYDNKIDNKKKDKFSFSDVLAIINTYKDNKSLIFLIYD